MYSIFYMPTGAAITGKNVSLHTIDIFLLIFCLPNIDCINTAGTSTQFNQKNLPNFCNMIAGHSWVTNGFTIALKYKLFIFGNILIETCTVWWNIMIHA